MLSFLNQLIPQSLKNFYHLLKAVLAVLRYRYPARHLTVIGVTGTDGKTTTSNIIYQLLLRSGYQVAVISTVGAFFGGQQKDLGFHVTTPDAHKLQRLIREIVDQGYKYLVLEATSHGLDQHRLFGTHIRYSIITNVTPEHLDYHRTYDRYLQAKAKLLRRARVAVLNKDDSSYPKLLKFVPPSAQLISYSSRALGRFRSVITSLWPEEYNQANAIAAAKLALHFGINPKTITKAFSQPIYIPGRMEVVKIKKGITGIVDFAHTPNALEKALTEASSETKGNLIAIFGKAGLRDPFNRPVMGNIGAAIADYVIFTAEDPRTENLDSIIYQMKQGVRVGHHKMISIPDRTQAIHFAITELAKPGDTVILLGKGHETSMNLDGQTEIPWSDKSALLDSFKAL